MPARVPAWWRGKRAPLVPMMAALAACLPSAAARLAGARLPAWADRAASYVIVAGMALAVAAVYVVGTVRGPVRGDGGEGR